MSVLSTIIELINQCPEYIGKGIVHLLIFTIGGILVAWVTTAVFGRRNEINAVEGALLKRKLEIYEELSGKLEALKAMVVIPQELYEAATKALMESDVVLDPVNSNQLLSLFDSPQHLTDEFLCLDKYISTKRLYYDNGVLIQTLRFQNYFACLRRLLVMFEEQFVDAKIPLEKQEVASAERLLSVELGIMLQDELVEQMDKVLSTMKQSFNDLNFAHRDQIEYSYDFFNNPDGPIMSDLIDTRLFSDREKISDIVANAIAIGMAGCIISHK